LGEKAAGLLAPQGNQILLNQTGGLFALLCFAWLPGSQAPFKVYGQSIDIFWANYVIALGRRP
jgi:hypothetical protein